MIQVKEFGHNIFETRKIFDPFVAERWSSHYTTHGTSSYKLAAENIELSAL